MRRYVASEASQHDMKLTQLGATVKQVTSKMCYVKFELENFELVYVYNLNKKGKYFLERVKPYPLPIKEYNSESDVIDIIKIDMEQFKNATNSRNIDEFISINSELHNTIKQFEDLFLYYNVPKSEADMILEKITEIQDEIKKTKETSTRLYFRKDPENI